MFLKKYSLTCSCCNTFNEQNYLYVDILKSIALMFKQLVTFYKGSSQKKTAKLWTLSKLLKPPPHQGWFGQQKFGHYETFLTPHPLGKFGHFGNKSLKAFILFRLKTVCLHRQVELLVQHSSFQTTFLKGTYVGSLDFQTVCSLFFMFLKE